MDAPDISSAYDDALVAGASVFGPWVIIALPVGVLLLAAAPAAGRGLGEWAGSWFRKKGEELA